MRSSILLLASLFVLGGCAKKTISGSTDNASGSGSVALCTNNLATSGFTSPVAYSPGTAGYNSMPVTVGESGSSTLCNGLNQICGSVTICIPGTSNCQVINNMLIDTGSYGVRVFTQALQQNVCNGLTQITDANSNPVAECAVFGSANLWGPIAFADVQLGGEPVVNMPIQIVNSNFSGVPSSCGTVQTSPDADATGFNGIIGVGLEAQDCGSSCVGIADNGTYFSCTAADGCSGTTLPLASQISQPVGAQTTSADNNGVILELPSVGSATGTAGVSGTLVFGIDTGPSNNSSNGQSLTFLQATQGSLGFYGINVNGASNSILDSGTNILLVPQSAAPAGASPCSQAPAFYCVSPTTSTLNLNVNLQATTGGPSTNQTIHIYDYVTLYETDYSGNGHHAFYDSAGLSESGLGGGYFMGLPFFYGRNVRVGIVGKTSTALGTGPYWAF